MLKKNFGWITWCILCFAGVTMLAMQDYFEKSKYKSILEQGSFLVEVSKFEEGKGFVLINDSLAISNNSRYLGYVRKGTFYPQTLKTFELSDLKPPFTLWKSAFNDTLHIRKETMDTIKFLIS